MRQTNILLLMCDQFRGDCLSIQDHPDVKTPFLDSIGHQGVVFENAYSATPSCIPARAALLTGRSQEGHGRVGYQDNVFQCQLSDPVHWKDACSSPTPILWFSKLKAS